MKPLFRRRAEKPKEMITFRFEGYDEEGRMVYVNPFNLEEKKVLHRDAFKVTRETVKPLSPECFLNKYL